MQKLTVATIPKNLTKILTDDRFTLATAGHKIEVTETKITITTSTVLNYFAVYSNKVPIAEKFLKLIIYSNGYVRRNNVDRWSHELLSQMHNYINRDEEYLLNRLDKLLKKQIAFVEKKRNEYFGDKDYTQLP